MTGYAHRFPRYGTLGLVILLSMTTAIFCSLSERFAGFPWWRITAWATPVCWWGYILTVDAWIHRRQGTSLLANRRRLLALQCVLSVAFWCLFEAYNRLLPGWQYVNLDPRLNVRLLGYTIAFATIMPGMFLTCELIQSYGLFAHTRTPRVRWSNGALNTSLAVGALFCVAPPFLPEPVRGYVWALVWTGLILLLEPINYRRGVPSLFRDWEHGELGRTVQLVMAGALCGILWEFWNMWAYTKWVYVFPLGQSVKLFEMPVLGFLGFLPFALEYFVMFHFVASFFTTEDELGL